MIGATSQIAQALAWELTTQAEEICLAGRGGFHLEEVAADLSLRSQSKITSIVFPMGKNDGAEDLVKTLGSRAASFDLIVVAYGEFGKHHAEKEMTPVFATETIEVNYSSVVALLCEFISKLDWRREMTFLVIGSIAGDRGKARNLVYASAKGALDFYLKGLRQKFRRTKIRFLTLKPGPTRSSMTKGIQSRLMADPKEIAPYVVRAAEKGREIIYAPRYWSVIMFVVRSIPESIFRRLSL